MAESSTNRSPDWSRVDSDPWFDGNASTKYRLQAERAGAACAWLESAPS